MQNFQKFFWKITPLRIVENSLASSTVVPRPRTISENRGDLGDQLPDLKNDLGEHFWNVEEHRECSPRTSCSPSCSPRTPLFSKYKPLGPRPAITLFSLSLFLIVSRGILSGIQWINKFLHAGETGFFTVLSHETFITVTSTKAFACPLWAIQGILLMIFTETCWLRYRF